MPVVVTGAQTALGLRLVDAFLAAGVPELRATTTSRAVARTLVDRGVRVAALDLATADVERAAAVLAGAHTVVHVDGDETLTALLEALEDGDVRRVVVVGRPDPLPPGVVVVDPDQPAEAVVAAVLAADRRETGSR